MLSVLLLVKDSELDDTRASSIDMRCEEKRSQREGSDGRRKGREGKGRESEKYLEEEENVMRRRRGENTAKTYLKPLNRGAKSR